MYFQFRSCSDRITQDLLNLNSVFKMEAQERMDCSDSEMIPSSPREEAGPDIPGIGMEQDVAADPSDSKNALLAKGLSLMMI